MSNKKMFLDFQNFIATWCNLLTLLKYNFVKCNGFMSQVVLNIARSVYGLRFYFFVASSYKTVQQICSGKCVFPFAEQYFIGRMADDIFYLMSSSWHALQLRTWIEIERETERKLPIWKMVRCYHKVKAGWFLQRDVGWKHQSQESNSN